MRSQRRPVAVVNEDSAMKRPSNTQSSACSRVRSTPARKKDQRHLGRRTPMRRNVQKGCVNLPVTASGLALRTSPVVQAQVIKLYLEGRNFVQIARQLHRDRRTVAKICRLPDVQAKITEIRERLLAEAEAWVESLNFAVTSELKGKLAYRLLKYFGVIPSPENNVQPENQSKWANIDGERLARARVIGQIALERGSSQPPESNELENLARRGER